MQRYVEQTVFKDIKKKLVILTGPRLVGKTYMSRQLMSYYQNPLYLHWDIPEHREQADIPGTQAQVELRDIAERVALLVPLVQVALPVYRAIVETEFQGIQVLVDIQEYLGLAVTVG
jgi:hypothetical protein